VCPEEGPPVIDTWLHWLAFGLCHQLPERSFFAVGGLHQVPVCSRDEGIYMGFVLSYLVIVAFARGRRPSESPARWLIGVGLLFIALMGLDGLTSYAGLRTTTNEIRLATGIGAGYAIALFLVPMLNAELWAGPGRARPLDGPWWEAGLWLLSMPVLWAVVYWLLPWLGLGYPLIVTVAILATFTLVNLVLVALLWPYDRRAVRLRDTMLPAVLGLVLTFAELAGAAALKYWLEVWTGTFPGGTR
jgi:uncharacterized membrane protein